MSCSVWIAEEIITRTPCINRAIYVIGRFGRSMCLPRHPRSTLCRERTCLSDYLARFAHCPRLGLAHPSSSLLLSSPPAPSLCLSLSFSRGWRHRRLAALNLTPLRATAPLRRTIIIVPHQQYDSTPRARFRRSLIEVKPTTSLSFSLLSAD